MSMSYASLDVNRLTASASIHKNAMTPRGRPLRVHLPQPLPPLWADEQRLSQVLGNLLD